MGPSLLVATPPLQVLERLVQMRLVSIERALGWASRHTGIPAIVLAAIAIVLAWRLGRHSVRFVVEVSVVVAILLVLTKLGLLKF